MNFKKFNIFASFENELLAVETTRNKDFFVNRPINYQGLNLAFHVEDDPEIVLQNRKLIAEKLNFEASSVRTMSLIHTNNVKIVDKNSPNIIDNCDALITNEKNIPLMVMVADCIPMMLFDKKNMVISVVHSGRNGTFLRIVSKVIQTMKSNFNSKAEDILVSFGSSIAFDCYEVSEDIGNICVKNFGNKFVKFENQKAFLNLPEINKSLVLSEGIPEKNIEVSSTCNHCDIENYFSYRKPDYLNHKIKNKNTGRFANIIMLK
jgi:YfiH family protein